MKIKLVSAEESALEYFELVGPGWDKFEETQSGDLIIAGALFQMRVGLHMEKPMQVIIAFNKFVKMRPFNEESLRASAALNKLDPAFPDDAWYGRAGHGFSYASKVGWWSPNLEPTRRPPEPSGPKFDTTIMDAAPYYNRLGQRRNK